MEEVTKRTPGPIPQLVSENFETLKAAFSNGHVALISAVRKSDNKDYYLLCAMGQDSAGNLYPVPFAQMLVDNPYETFEDPTQ